MKIVDLGTACFATDKNDYEIGTRNYRGPECILGIRFTQAIDIWAVACMVVELLDGEVLFDPGRSYFLTWTFSFDLRRRRRGRRV